MSESEINGKFRRCLTHLCRFCLRLYHTVSSPCTAEDIPRTHVPQSDKWMIANIQEVGYYRVNYDQENWKLLIGQLQRNHRDIHTTNRAQILDDSLDIARAGLLDYHIALNVTRYLINEADYAPWDAALSGFSFMDGMLRRTAAYGLWKVRINPLTLTVFNQRG